VPGPVFIDGDSITLRTIEHEDVEFLQANANRPGVREYAGGDTPYNRPRYESERVEPLSSGEFVELLVCVDGERVGDVSLAPIDDRRGWANLGYWIDPDYQGEGYATAAARLVVDHGFAELRLHRVSATVVAGNEASRRVVEKLGFTHEGTKREDAFVGGEYVDRAVYGLLRREWEG